MAPGDTAGDPPVSRETPGPAAPSRAFDREVRAWVVAGSLLLLVLAIVPQRWEGSFEWTQRLGTVLSLLFLVAAANLALGMRRRAFLVAGLVVAVLYAASAWLPLAINVHDFFVIAAIAGFLIFALAGFNLVFVLEEMVFDADRILAPRSRVWNAIPTLSVWVLAIGLPWWRQRGGPELDAVWGASVASAILLGGWWVLVAFNDLPQRRILPELHLFVMGILAATALSEGLVRLGHAPALAGSLAVYLAILGTWVYVSYTTIQRTHFLLGGGNTMAWVSLLLAASYAVLVHVQQQYHSALDPNESLSRVMQIRIGYMVVGVWIGLASYVLRTLWKVLRVVRHWSILGRYGRMTAGRAARVAEEVLDVERRVGAALGGVLWSVERTLPGRRDPRPRGWDIDPTGLHPIETSEE